MANFSSIVMAVAMVTALLLIAGGVKLVLNRQTRGRGILMIVAALVMVMNVMIGTV
jgi:ABC-type sugar transport system permease subunit